MEKKIKEKIKSLYNELDIVNNILIETGGKSPIDYDRAWNDSKIIHAKLSVLETLLK